MPPVVGSPFIVTLLTILVFLTGALAGKKIRTARPHEARVVGRHRLCRLRSSRRASSPDFPRHFHKMGKEGMAYRP